MLRFATDFDASWDNNQAERDVRMVKVQQKISGSLAHLSTGAENYCAITSYISTMRKHGHPVLAGLRQLFEGEVWLPVRSSRGPEAARRTTRLTGKTDVMAKRQNAPPRHPRRPLAPHRAQPALLDGVVNPVDAHWVASTSSRCSSPCVLGALDEHLEEIGDLRQRPNCRDSTPSTELVAASRLHVGDHVRLGHNLKPHYLHGKSAYEIASGLE